MCSKQYWTSFPHRDTLKLPIPNYPNTFLIKTRQFTKPFHIFPEKILISRIESSKPRRARPNNSSYTFMAKAASKASSTASTNLHNAKIYIMISYISPPFLKYEVIYSPGGNSGANSIRAFSCL